MFLSVVLSWTVCPQPETASAGARGSTTDYTTNTTEATSSPNGLHGELQVIVLQDLVY